MKSLLDEYTSGRYNSLDSGRGHTKRTHLANDMIFQHRKISLHTCPTPTLLGKWMVHYGTFSTIFQRETTSLTSCWLTINCSPTDKGIGNYSKKKEFVPLKHMFPFRIDPYWHRRQQHFNVSCFPCIFIGYSLKNFSMIKKIIQVFFFFWPDNVWITHVHLLDIKGLSNVFSVKNLESKKASNHTVLICDFAGHILVAYSRFFHNTTYIDPNCRWWLKVLFSRISNHAYDIEFVHQSC